MGQNKNLATSATYLTLHPSLAHMGFCVYCFGYKNSHRAYPNFVVSLGRFPNNINSWKLYEKDVAPTFLRLAKHFFF